MRDGHIVIRDRDRVRVVLGVDFPACGQRTVCDIRHREGDCFIQVDEVIIHGGHKQRNTLRVGGNSKDAGFGVEARIGTLGNREDDVVQVVGIAFDSRYHDVRRNGSGYANLNEHGFFPQLACCLGDGLARLSETNDVVGRIDGERVRGDCPNIPVRRQVPQQALLIKLKGECLGAFGKNIVSDAN